MRLLTHDYSFYPLFPSHFSTTCFCQRYETLVFDTELPPDLSHAPEVSLTVFDKDRLTPNNPVGQLRIPLDVPREGTAGHGAAAAAAAATAAATGRGGAGGAGAGMAAAAAAAVALPVVHIRADELRADARIGEERARVLACGPVWHDLFVKDAGDCEGRLLVKVELVGPVQPSDQLPAVPRAMPLPETKSCWVEVTAVGVRGMKPYISLLGRKYVLRSLAMTSSSFSSTSTHALTPPLLLSSSTRCFHSAPSAACCYAHH